MTERLQAELRDQIARILEVDPADMHPDAHFVEDLDGHSIELLEVVMVIEKRYQVVVGPDMLPAMYTLSGIAKVVNELLDAKE